MSKRGDITRTKILEAARDLFSAKGYSCVTMQDIRIACGLSRGGLYRHYSSTEEIFGAMIKSEQEDAFNALNKARENGVSAYIMLRTFLRTRMDALLDPKSSIDNAIGEFAKNSSYGKEMITERAANSVKILSELIELSAKEGRLSCDMPYEAALNIMCLYEGIAKHNDLIPLTRQDAEEQLKLIGRLLGGEI